MNVEESAFAFIARNELNMTMGAGLEREEWHDEDDHANDENVQRDVRDDLGGTRVGIRSRLVDERYGDQAARQQ